MPYHFNSTGLAPGSVILPGNWGRIILRAARAHQSYEPEMAWEEIRKIEFPQLPSRLCSAYFFYDEKEARFYGNRNLQTQCTMLLYEVEMLNDAAIRHATDWNLAPSSSKMHDPDAIREYWRGHFPFVGPHGENRREVLAETPLKILRRLEF